jgi:hypothetical protein
LLTVEGDAECLDEGCKAMMVTTIVVFLLALVASFRFPLPIIIPAILFDWLVIFIGGIAEGASVTSIALCVGSTSIAIQAGYMSGIGLQWLLGAGGQFLGRSWGEKPTIARDGAF